MGIDMITYALAKGYTDKKVAGATYDDTELNEKIEELKKNIEEIPEPAKINDATLTGELSSVADLKIAGKVFEVEDKDSTGEVFNDYENNIANGDYAHAEGGGTRASASYSHAEGQNTMAVGSYSHAEGGGGSNSGNYTQSTSNSTILSDYSSYPFTLAKGNASHCEGNCTLALGNYSHAEGYRTKALGNHSHTEGYDTIASSPYQHAQGKYNKEDSGEKYVFIIGNGTSKNERSNAIAIDWDGKIYVNNSETGVDLNTVVQDIANKLDKADIVNLTQSEYDELEAAGTLTALQYNIVEG